MNWYAFCVAEYMVETAHLSNEQDLCYRRLLDLYYTGETALTLEVKVLARKVRCSVETCQQVLEEYFSESAEGWQHERCNREIVKYHVRSSSNRANVQKRWLKKSSEEIPIVCDSNTTGIRSYNDGIRSGYQTKSTESTSTKSTESITHSTKLENTPNQSRSRPSVVVEKPDGVSDQVWADFLTHRRNRKAPLTATAFKTIQSEAAKAGKSLETALETMISRGWTGYKAEWDIADSRPQNGRYTRNQLATTHIPNMPLGATSCSCGECVAFREKLKTKSENYNPNL